MKRLDSIERTIQEEVDRKVVISHIQEKLPKISKHNGVVDAEKEKEEPPHIEDKDYKDDKVEVTKSQDQEQESTEASSSGEEAVVCKTPDQAPRSFQDKR